MALYDKVLKKGVDQVFAQYDVDHTNSLGREEIKKLLRDGYRNLRADRYISEDDVDCFLRAVDVGHNGRITRAELIRTLKKVTENP